MQSKYNLFIDDQINDFSINPIIAVRCPKKIDPSRDYIAFKTVNESIDFMKKNGCPIFISFDHDLGDNEPTGYDLCKWLIEYDMDNNGSFIPSNFDFQVHSKNPIGKKAIEGLLTNYLNQR